MMHLNGSLINFDDFDEPLEVRAKAYMNASSGGPNSGFEIDNLLAFKEATFTNEFPEMKEEVQLMISSEAYVNRLLEFRGRVQSAKGMSRGMAHELMELIPTMESFTSPKHFTELVSGVGLEMSLEAINAKVWALVIAAIAFVAGLIHRFTNWFSGGKKSTAASMESAGKEGVREAEQNFKSNTESLKKSIEATRKLRDEKTQVRIKAGYDREALLRSRVHEQMKKIVEDAEKAAPREVYKTPEEIKAEMADKIRNHTALTHEQLVPKERVIEFNLRELALAIGEDGAKVYDYLTNPDVFISIVTKPNSPMNDLIVDLINNFGTLLHPVMAKVDMLRDISEVMVNNIESFGPKEIDKSVTAEYEVLYNKEAVETRTNLRFGGVTFPNMDDIAGQLHEALTSTGFQRPPFKDLQDFLTAYAAAMNHYDKADFKKLQDMFYLLTVAEKAFAEVEKNVEKAHSEAKDWTPNPDLVEHANRIIEVANVVQRDLRMLVKIQNLLTTFLAVLSEDAMKILFILARNIDSIELFYKRFDLEIPQELEECRGLVKKEVEKAVEHPVRKNFIPAKMTTTVTVGNSKPMDGTGIRDELN